jgi:hypothetical protein
VPFATLFGAATRAAEPGTAPAVIAGQPGAAGGSAGFTAFVHPHRDVGGLQGFLYDGGQVLADRVEVDGVLEPGRV